MWVTASETHEKLTGNLGQLRLKQSNVRFITGSVWPPSDSVKFNVIKKSKYIFHTQSASIEAPVVFLAAVGMGEKSIRLAGKG
jgi:hypothetical protein